MYDDVQTFYPDRKPQPGDDNMNVTFEVRQVYDAKASEGYSEEVYSQERNRVEIVKHEGAGRAIYKPVDWITMWNPGDKDTVQSRPVWNDPRNPKSDTARFPRHYAAFKAGQSAVHPGTPLHVLAFIVPPILTETDVAEFKHDGVHTCEQLADMSDGLGQRYRGFAQLKAKVQKYLGDAKLEAPAASLRAEVARRDSEIATLRKALEDQGAMLAKLAEGREEAVPARRGRPPKTTEAQP